MIVVDARGHRCPTPSLLLQKAVRSAPPGERMRLLATDPMARIDAPHLMAALGGQVTRIEEAGGVLTIEIVTPGAAEN